MLYIKLLMLVFIIILLFFLGVGLKVILFGKKPPVHSCSCQKSDKNNCSCAGN